MRVINSQPVFHRPSRFSAVGNEVEIMSPITRDKDLCDLLATARKRWSVCPLGRNPINRYFFGGFCFLMFNM